ncbi:hypothetical protein CSQ85_12225 [Bifidobacterium rousetti]|uniref:hypothetical protein n=1 Tax=Bifidobacterium rousetti TaxID=2045439 RepID=UPI00123C0D70|nr:hypothetical protein [Bifidobacterium rousetti]KAA8815688.1 hypothetical protein CSQ85_12225 [Bifidobacterium rousetti]
MNLNNVNPNRLATTLLATIGEGFRRQWEHGAATVTLWDYDTGRDIRILPPDKADMMAGARVIGVEEWPDITDGHPTVGCLISITRNGDDETVLHMHERTIVDAIAETMPIEPVNY